ncbi:MAG: transglutaminase-like domain-containing protein [Clostridiaceae bacterium]
MKKTIEIIILVILNIILVMAISSSSFKSVFAESKAITSNEYKEQTQENSNVSVNESYDNEVKSEENEVVIENESASAEATAQNTDTNKNEENNAETSENVVQASKTEQSQATQAVVEESKEQTVTKATETLAPVADPELDDSNKNNGSISVKYSNNTSKKMKIAITKDGSSKYYDFSGNGSYESFSLQGGSGQYTITLFLNDSGTKYTSLKTWTVQASIGSSNSVYLNSNQIVNYASAPNAVSKANALVCGITSDESKVNAIYNFVVNNIYYDAAKATSVGSGYIPNIDSTYSSKSGICYDFSAIFAGMLRSVGVPTKLVMGTSSNVSGYHAWNEVYINGTWKVVDTSYDSQAKAANVSYSMIKSASSYSKTKEY